MRSAKTRFFLSSSVVPGEYWRGPRHGFHCRSAILRLQNTSGCKAKPAAMAMLPSGTSRTLLKSPCRCISSRPCPMHSRNRISCFKVFSGVLKNDATIQNFQPRRSGEIRAHLRHAGQRPPGSGERTARGRHWRRREKLKDTLTGDTLGGADRRRFSIRRVKLAEPAITFAIELQEPCR